MYSAPLALNGSEDTKGYINSSFGAVSGDHGLIV
jgi:hypothetical protein